MFPPTALSDPNATGAQQAILQQQLNVLAYSPYGDSPLFRNLLSDPKKKEEVRVGGASALCGNSLAAELFSFLAVFLASEIKNEQS